MTGNFHFYVEYKTNGWYGGGSPALNLTVGGLPVIEWNHFNNMPDATVGRVYLESGKKYEIRMQFSGNVCFCS